MEQVSHKTFFDIFQIKTKHENKVFIQDVVESMREILNSADPNFCHEVWWKIPKYLSKCRKVKAFDTPLFEFEKDISLKPSTDDLKRLWVYFFDTLFAVDSNSYGKCLYDFVKNSAETYKFACKLTDSLKFLNVGFNTIIDWITLSSTGEYDEDENLVLKFYYKGEFSTKSNPEFYELIKDLKTRRAITMIQKENGDWESRDKSVLILSAKNANMINYSGSANGNFFENQMAMFYPTDNLLTKIDNPRGYSICDSFKSKIALAKKDRESPYFKEGLVRIIEEYADADIEISHGRAVLKDNSYTQFLASCIFNEQYMLTHIMLKDERYSLVVVSQVKGLQNSTDLNESLKKCQIK